MIAPPTNSLMANCQPIRTTSTAPNSMTKFVDANKKTFAAMKSAPFTKSDLDIADAA